MTVLVVAAHPDDEVLGAGGTIARLARSEQVHIRILGEGVTSRSASRTDADPTEVARLADDARTAASILGAASIELGGLPDNRFDEVALLDVVKRVEAWVGELSPEVVYTHHGGDLNIDHSITARAVLTATRPVPGCPVRELYAFEVASSTEWAFGALGAFRPTTFVDVSEHIDDKVKALEAYALEVRPFPHPRSADNLRTAAHRWGATVGVAYAEAFEQIRAIR